MRLAILGGLVLLILGLPVAMGQEAPLYQEKIPQGSCEGLTSREAFYPDPRGAYVPLCGPEACLDPGNGSGGGGGGGSSPICSIACRLVCIPVQQIVCTPVPPLWQPACRVVVYNECRQVCETQCR